MRSDASRGEFRFGLGHLTLEFLATNAGRFREPLDRLATPGDLEIWLEQAGLEGGGRCGADHLDDARTLREAIWRTLESARAGRRPRRRDIDLINRWARQAPPVAQLSPTLGLVRTAVDPARAALARIAVASVELLSGSDLTRVRNCASASCSLLFIDRSRPGRRRWCSMARCGNRSKTATYRRRQRHRSAA